jgi:hypothetical protein
LGQDNLEKYILDYYIQLFGPSVINNCVMEESIIHDIKQISEEENTILTADFTEKEIFYVISQMEKNKAPALMGFRPNFIKGFVILSRGA